MAQMQAQPGENYEGSDNNLTELFDKLASTVALKPGDEADPRRSCLMRRGYAA